MAFVTITGSVNVEHELMQRVRVKICGITRPEDGVYAAALGADAIGLVFYQSSPRYVGVSRAREIVNALPPFISKVGLFVDQDEETITSVLTELPLDILQFHGNESAGECSRYGVPYIKAARMCEDINLIDFEQNYGDASALLLDTHIEGVAGGTGQVFDWKRIPARLNTPVIVAGGLTPENVANAISQVSPYGVDVSGGVESQRGIKDHAKIDAFITSVNKASLK